MRKYLYLIAILIPSILISTPSAADSIESRIKKGIEGIKESITAKACSVGPLVTKFYLQNFEVKGCEDGDTVHVQVDNTKVARSGVIAVMCDLSKQVLVERSRTIDHIVCVLELKKRTMTKFKDTTP